MGKPLTFSYTNRSAVHRHARTLNRKSELRLPEDERRAVFALPAAWLGEPLTEGGPETNVLVLAELEHQRQVNKACASVLAALVVAILAIAVVL